MARQYRLAGEGSRDPGRTYRHSFCVDTECECRMRLSTLVNTNAALLEALERMAACVHPHKTELNVVWVDSASVAQQWEIARAAIAQAKGENK